MNLATARLPEIDVGFLFLQHTIVVAAAVPCYVLCHGHHPKIKFKVLLPLRNQSEIVCYSPLSIFDTNPF